MSVCDYHRDRQTKNPVVLNRRTGRAAMGIESERHHRSGLLTEGKGMPPKSAC